MSLLPWEYGVRNLFRRPVRSALTLFGLTLVVLLVFVVVGFVRGLEATLAVSGDPHVVLVHALGSSENIENSTVPASSAALLAASLDCVQRRHGTAYASPELYLGTRWTSSARSGSTWNCKPPARPTTTPPSAGTTARCGRWLGW